jgi:hypothetical protein
MSCLGVHFSIDEAEVRKLRGFDTDPERLAYVQDDLEEHYLGSDPKRAVETDKAWDAIHRALTDGTLDYADRKSPFGHLILGGEPLYSKDDYIMSLKSPAQVQEVLPGLRSMTKERFRPLYFSIPQADYGVPLSEGDFEYTWAHLSGLPPFWELAAAERRYILFTADQ